MKVVLRLSAQARSSMASNGDWEHSFAISPTWRPSCSRSLGSSFRYHMGRPVGEPFHRRSIRCPCFEFPSYYGILERTHLLIERRNIVSLQPGRASGVEKAARETTAWEPVGTESKGYDAATMPLRIGASREFLIA